MGLLDLPEKILMWPFNKVDGVIQWIKRQWRNHRYKKKTEMMRFGVYWKYLYRYVSNANKQRMAIPYCPKKSCRVELVFDTNINNTHEGKTFCPECKLSYILKDKDGVITYNQAQARATHIFKSKSDLD